MYTEYLSHVHSSEGDTGTYALVLIQTFRDLLDLGPLLIHRANRTGLRGYTFDRC